MKVMCIVNGWMNVDTGEKIHGPKYLEECIVINLAETDRLRYSLQYYPREIGYDAKFFIPLSNIDEKEIIKERQLVKV